MRRNRRQEKEPHHGNANRDWPLPTPANHRQFQVRGPGGCHPRGRTSAGMGQARWPGIAARSNVDVRGTRK
ncbi:MAG: hypothetical protein EB039_11125, partial [Proteobacteria bacterium]|nr:hypothetical protein [Pseudomonadota bacterium]